MEEVFKLNQQKYQGLSKIAGSFAFLIDSLVKHPQNQPPTSKLSNNPPTSTLALLHTSLPDKSYMSENLPGDSSASTYLLFPWW